MDSENTDFDDSANDVGGVGDTLRPMEALDSDDVRNDDGDEVVDPPDTGESVEQTGATELLSDDDVDRLLPDDHGSDEGQVSGTPEDGDSIFPEVE
jgi:hypothetical protein